MAMQKTDVLGDAINAAMYRAQRDVLREAYRSQHSYPPMTKVHDLPLPENNEYRLRGTLSAPPSPVGRKFRDDD